MIFFIAINLVVVPISAAHLEWPVPFECWLVHVSVANDVGEGKAASPDISAPTDVELERIWAGEVVPGSK